MLLFGRVPKGWDPCPCPSLLPPRLPIPWCPWKPGVLHSWPLQRCSLRFLSLSSKGSGSRWCFGHLWAALQHHPVLCHSLSTCPRGLNHWACACHWPGACLLDFPGLLRWCVATAKRGEHGLQSQLEQAFGLSAVFPCTASSSCVCKTWAPGFIPGICFLSLTPCFLEPWDNGKFSQFSVRFVS